MKRIKIWIGYIFLSLLFIFMSSCKIKKTNNEEKINRITILNKYNKKFDLYEIIDTSSYWYIPLETNSESSFGTINKVFIDQDRIFILDREYAKKALIFNIDGRFIGQIGNKGKALNEYQLLQDLDIDTKKKQLVLFDVASRKLLYYNYNGEFIKTVQLLQYPGMTFSIISPQRIAFYLHRDQIEEKIINEQLLIFSQTGELVSQHFPFVNKEIIYLMPHYFSKIGKNIFFIPIFYDKMYKIDKKANISMVFDFQIGDLMIKDEDKKNCKTSAELFKLKKFINFNFLVVNDRNQFICTNNYNDIVFNIIGNLDTKKIRVGCIRYGNENMPSGVIGSYKDYFIAQFHPYYFDLGKSFPNSKKDDNYGLLLYKIN